VVFSVWLTFCSDYANNYDLAFNVSKTICTVVGKPKFTVSNVFMDNSVINWTDRFKYLGVYFVSGSDLSVDVTPVRRKLYVACNSLNARCHGLAEPVRVQRVINPFVCL